MGQRQEEQLMKEDYQHLRIYLLVRCSRAATLGSLLSSWHTRQHRVGALSSVLLFDHPSSSGHLISYSSYEA